MVQKLLTAKTHFIFYYCAKFNSLDAGFFFNNISVSNSLDTDQARHFVRPDLAPNCLQRLSEDDKSHHQSAKS